MIHPKNKIPKTFVGFLIASFIIWFLITLSKEYNTIIRYSIDYKNLPQDKLLQEEPVKELDIAVKATGFKLISSKFKSQKIDIQTFDLKRKKASKFYLLPKNQVVNIQKQLPSGIVLQEILRDTIYLDLGSLTSKKVPIKSNLDIQYYIGYDAETVKITPDSIVISGPEAQVKEIKSIDLAVLKLDNVKDDFTKKVAIIKPINSKNIKLSDDFVSIYGKVEKFTEGSVKVPFKVINISEKTQLNTLTKTVEVIFVTGLSNFNKVDKNSFEVECDFGVSEKNNLSYLLPKIIKKPSFIKSFRVVPNKIDFLIQK